MFLILVEKDHGKARVGNYTVIMISASHTYGLSRRKHRSLKELDSLRFGDASRLLIEDRLLGHIFRLPRKRNRLGFR